MRTLFFTVCLVFAAAIAKAQDQTIALQRGEGPIAALVRVGCDPAWFSQVAADTPLDPARGFRHLPVGQPLKIMMEDCTVPAPPGVVNLTRLLLRVDVDRRESKQLREEVASLRGMAQSEKVRAETAEERENRLKATVTELEGQLKTEREKTKEKERQALASARRSTLKWLFALASAIIVSGLAGWYLGSRRARRKFESRNELEPKQELFADTLTLPDPYPVVCNDEVHLLPLSEKQVEGWKQHPEYTCPHCGEEKIQRKHAVRHLAERCQVLKRRVQANEPLEVEVVNLAGDVPDTHSANPLLRRGA